MYVTWLQNGFPHSHLAWLFKIYKSTVTRCMTTWAIFLYFSLGATSILFSSEALGSTVPLHFV